MAERQPAPYRARGHYQQDRVAADYDRERFSSWHGRLAHRLEVRALQRVIAEHFQPGDTVLDLPCGTGRLLPVYVPARLRVTGADISGAMLDRARERLGGSRQFAWQRCDAEQLPLADDAVDHVVSFRLMCHLPADARRRVLTEMCRVSRGVIAVNYHLDVRTPLMLVNRALRRPAGILPYPLRRCDLDAEFAGLPVARHDVFALSWFERSSSMVVLRRR